MLSQKGFAQVLFMLILLVGIATTVYLTQFTQVFKPRAANDESIASLTEQLISQNSQIKKDSAQSGTAQSLTGDMASTAFRRKQKLLELTRTNPKEFLKQATLASKAGDFPSNVQDSLEKIVEEQGKVINLHFDDFENKKSHEQYYIQT